MIAVLSLIAELGKDVVVDGSVATVIAQHLITTVPEKRAVYFDVPGNAQTVAYVPKGFDCKGPALLEAHVIEVKGGGKRQKSEDVFTEAHLDVTKWQCLAASPEELVKQLGSADVDARILELGKAAIPALVRHLDDARVFKVERRLLNVGELTGRPANAPPVKEQWAEVTVTVGDHCRELLDRMTAPPQPANRKPIGAPAVADWAKWWREHWHQSLEQMRASR